ncbi:MAG: 50S ribosomal protein L11 methyltransferase [Clostridia bacterium]|nr:50S ribosomal protein L11 methyltransferase [Clostridia bacterium]
MNGKWTKLTVRCKTEELECVSAVMSMLDNGLMIEDFSDFSLNGMYGELVDEKILSANREVASVSIFVPEEKSLAEYRAFLAERFNYLGISPEIEFEGVNEEDWAENWKKYYKPVKIGRVTIVPAWEKYDAAEGEVVVRMDPGMAFGTGTHETTRLVLRFIEEELRGGELVLDVGTGSGILSICASKLGARYCCAYDIDPVAVKVARENVRDGGVDNVSVDVSDLLSSVDKSRGKYDFAVANIVADIIVRMMPDISEYLTPDASLVLSGIIADREEEVVCSVRECGFEVVRRLTENDWVGLLVKRKV